jgi:hypothetical protein
MYEPFAACKLQFGSRNYWAGELDGVYPLPEIAPRR